MTPEEQSAIDAILMAGIEQRAWLDRDPHPALDVSLAEAVTFYGGPRAALSLWRMVSAVERLRTLQALKPVASDRKRGSVGS